MLFSSLLKNFILPPGSPLLLGLLGVVLLYRRRKLGITLMVVGLLSAYLLSLPITANLLSSAVQIHPPLNLAELDANDAEAIVILAGGLYQNAPEYAGDSVNTYTLGRLRYGARLARQTRLPVLVSGGGTNPDVALPMSEARLMQAILQQEFGIDQVLAEPDSSNTRENALDSAQLLNANGIKRVYLVTHAAHMARSVRAFERVGIDVIPAPTLFFPTVPEPSWLTSWFPDPQAAQEIRYTLHEVVGQIWYWLRDDVLNPVSASDSPANAR